MAWSRPSNVAELDDTALEDSLKAAKEAFKEIGKKKNEDISDEEFAVLRELKEFVTEAKGAQDQRAAEAAQREADIAELRTAFEDPKKDEAPADAVEDPADAPTVPAEPEAPADIVADEPIIEPSPEAELLPEGDPIPEAPAEEEPKDDEDFVAENEQEPVAAMTASAKPSLADAKKNAPDEAESLPVSRGFNLVAAASVPGITAGTEFLDFSAEGAGKAIVASLNTLPQGFQRNTRVRNSALVMQAKNSEFVQNSGDDTDLLLAASNEKRLKGGNVVAAGGWGAPSEQKLDFCKLETTDGLFDLPGISITRNGVKYTKGPDLNTVMLSSTGFWDMTEATAEAGVEQKTSLRPTEPDFAEVRMDAVGIMMEAGLLMRNGWPELIQRYAELLVVAHEHKVSKKLVDGVLGYTGAGVDLTGGFGNALDLLHVLELVIISERQKFYFAQNQSFEMILPVWAKAVFRADLAQRTGVDFLTITDEQINAWFTQRGGRVQWLSQYQNLTIDATAKIALGYNDKIDVVIYPAGAFVKGTTDVISLDTVYDSTNLKKNDYVHLFMEQGVLVTNPCYEGRRFQVPFAATGITAAANSVAAFKTAVAPVVP